MCTTIEVNKNQYDHIRIKYAGFAAHRRGNGKFFIKFLTLAGLDWNSIEKELNKLA